MMENINRILVVSRLTTHCKLAIHYGISLAKKYQASLTVMHTVHSPFGLEGWNLPPLEQDYAALRARSKADIDAAIQAEQSQGLSIREMIREGDPVTTVIDLVQAEQMDLLIMLAHEQGHLEHFLFGRCNDALIRRMPCTIVLVKKEPAIFGEVD
jgi:universal stress protein A